MNEAFERDRTKKKLELTFERVYFGVLIFILAAIVLFNVTSSLGTLPGFCGICHGPSHESWRGSAHSGIHCNVCHGGSDLFGALSGRAKLAGMIPSQVTGLYRKPVITTVSNDKCMLCHSYITGRTIQSKALKVSHKEIVEAEYACGDCHSTVVHGKTATRQNFAEIGKCLKCHNGNSASGKCETCHSEEEGLDRRARIDGSWQISHGKNWRKMHGMGDISTCQTCHSKLYCNRCHNTELPHSKAWLTTHGKDIKGSKSLIDGCKQCHKGALCDGCHQMQMPHPKDFLPKHSKIVEKDGSDACYNCHLKEGCTVCHKFHAHRGIPQDKLRMLRKEAGLD